MGTAKSSKPMTATHAAEQTAFLESAISEIRKLAEVYAQWIGAELAAELEERAIAAVRRELDQANEAPTT